MDGVQCLSGRYRLVERLGAGGMSVVWRGHDEVLGRPVAVKLLTPKFASDPASRDRIRAEARAAARLNHPYITDVYDYGESEVDGRTVPFVVMELVEGQPLDEYLADGPMPWRTAVELGAQVAAALAAVHDRGLVHRDVKPANIMLTATGAKLVDFGISAVAGDTSEAPGKVYGTPAYLAPERLDGGPADAASDVYALGLVLYKMLAGDLPWDADTTTQMLRAHCYVDPTPLPRIPGLPAAVTNLCRRSLSKRPAMRPSTAEIAGILGAVTGLRIPVVGLSARANASAATKLDPLTQTQPAGVPLRLKLSGAAARFRTALPTALPAALPTALRTVLPASWPRPPRLRRSVAGVGALGIAAVATAFGAISCAGPDEPSDRSVSAAGMGAGGDTAGAVQTTRPLPGCRVEYRTRADNGGRFIVDLTIANTGSAELPQWALAFDYGSDQRILSVTGAQSTQDGGTVRLEAATPLAPGASTTVSLVGSYTAGNPMPSGFELAGQRCSEELVGAAAPTSVTNNFPTNGGPADGPAPDGPGAGPADGPAGPVPPGEHKRDNSGPGGSNSGKGKKKDD